MVFMPSSTFHQRQSLHDRPELLGVFTLDLRHDHAFLAISMSLWHACLMYCPKVSKIVKNVH